MAEITKLSIMRSFFELETPDFAWKFVRTVRIKYKTYKKFLISTKVQSTQTSVILELQNSDFAKIKKCKIPSPASDALPGA